MCRPDAGEAAGEGGHGQPVGMVGEIAGDLLCGGRNAAAPGEKVRQVALIGAAGA